MSSIFPSVLTSEFIIFYRVYKKIDLKLLSISQNSYCINIQFLIYMYNYIVSLGTYINVE